MARILIIDDDPAMVQVISTLCIESDHIPVSYSCAEKALAFMGGQSPQLIVTDLRMDKVDGMGILRAARELLPEVPVMVVSANKQLGAVVDAMRAGAVDYLTKPFKLDELKACIHRALSGASRTDDRSRPHARVAEAPEDRAGSFVGRSPRMRELFALMEKVADTESTILISGESGTGKELVAKALHFKSSRSGRPFVAVNCSALPEGLLESELFGHKKGAFTGATQDKEGLFEVAEGGTIFLDEINSMSALLQTKLLRVLQERILRRVGDTRSIPIRVRVLAATNEPLFEKVQEGGFREDLYYRLAVIPLELPALRERREDIPLLVEHFLEKHARAYPGHPPFRVESDAEAALKAYRWPGNVRELENAIERACALSEGGVIRLKDLPPQVLKPGLEQVQRKVKVSASVVSAEAPLPLGTPLSEFIAAQEIRFIEETLRVNHGLRERAALMLGISTATLYRKLEHTRKIQRPKPSRR